MASSDELACVYSALILQDNNSPVTAEKIQALLKAANVDVEPFWPGLFAKAVESINLKDLVSNVGSGVGAAGAAPEAAAAAPAADAAAGGDKKKKEEKKEEEEEEDEDMGFGLFD